MVQRFGHPNLCCWTDIARDEQIMHSPLPDSSALEAGILEDERPSRLSRVQDNVRNLLRTSTFGSVRSSPTTPTHPAASTQIPRTSRPPTPLFTPSHWHHEVASDRVPTPAVPPIRFNTRPEVIPSPTSGTSTGSSDTHLSETVAAFPHPPESYQQQVQHMAHQSTLFNTRAVAALNHPDVSHPSMEQLSQQKQQCRHRSAWRKPRRSRKAAQRFAGSGGILCLLASLLLAALVATYVTIGTSQPDLTTTFHVLFVLGICLATIVFSYSVVRLFLIGKESQSHHPTFVSVTRHGRSRNHRHHHHHHHHRPPHLRCMTASLTDPVAFVPPTPIAVHVSSDDVRLDPSEAHPTATAEANSNWDKEVNSVPNPPPAYGRWRGSVRADPELLHWQAVPLPLSPDTPVLPSPTYEESMAVEIEQHNESPPSYMTRDSPARQREMQEARAGIAHPQQPSREPEMVEVRSVGIDAGP